MLPFTVVFASIPLIGGIHALRAESGIPPVPSAIPMTHKAGLDIPQWTKVQMTKNDKTFPADKGPWGGIGPGHWEFAFTPEGNDGGYRREDFDVKLFKHEGNWTLIQEQWAYESGKPEAERVALPPVDKKISCTIIAAKPLTESPAFEIKPTEPYISSAEVDGVKAECRVA